MATVKLVIKKKATKSDGTTPIYLQYSYNSQIRSLIKTGYDVKPSNWNFSKDEVRKSSDEHEKINDNIQACLRNVNEVLLFAKNNGIDPTIDFVKSEYVKIGKGFKPVQMEQTLFDYFDEFMLSHQSKVSPLTIDCYKATKKTLEKFQATLPKPLTFSSFDFSFYESYTNFLRKNIETRLGKSGLKDNTIGNYIKNLKAFLNFCVKSKLCPPIDLSSYKRITEEVEQIFLNETELEKIYQLDLSENQQLEQVRDWFLIGCNTGLRYSDFSRLKPEYIKDGLIFMTQQKVNKSVVVPLIGHCEMLLKKYNSRFPQINIEEFNENIKIIGQMAVIDDEIHKVYKHGDIKEEKVYKKHELMSSHVCRRSFCTNMYLRGIEPQLIMKISGHKTETEFKKYLRIDNYVSALKLKEMWLKK